MASARDRERIFEGRTGRGYPAGVELEVGRPVSSYTTPELLRELGDEGRRLIRAEVQLAKDELRAEVKEAGKAAASAGGSAVIIHTGWLVLVGAAVFGLASVMPLWTSCLLIGAALLIAGALLGKFSGWDRVKRIHGPTRTIQTLKEDQQWAKETIRSAKSDVRANA